MFTGSITSKTDSIIKIPYKVVFGSVPRSIQESSSLWCQNLNSVASANNFHLLLHGREHRHVRLVLELNGNIFLKYLLKLIKKFDSSVWPKKRAWITVAENLLVEQEQGRQKWVGLKILESCQLSLISSTVSSIKKHLLHIWKLLHLAIWRKKRIFDNSQ